MSKNRTDKEKLRDRINTNKYLLQKIAIRKSDPLPFPDMSKALLDRYKKRLWEDLFNYMPFTNRPSLEKIELEGSFLVTDEKKALAAFENKALRTYYYDALAFEESFVTAVNSYKPEKGTKFTTWFSYLYTQKVTESITQKALIKNQHFTSALKDDEIKFITSIQNLADSYGVTLNNLSDDFKEKIAEHLGCNKEQLTYYINIRNMQYNVISFNTEMTDEGNAASRWDTVEDSNTPSPEQLIDNIDRIITFLTFAKKDMKEYPLLFLNNKFLHPLKDDLSESESENAIHPLALLELYNKFEPQLMSILVRPYLCFCLYTPPEPDTINHIYECEVRHRFIQKSISMYTSLSSARVTQLKHEFEELYQRLIEKCD